MYVLRSHASHLWSICIHLPRLKNGDKMHQSRTSYDDDETRMSFVFYTESRPYSRAGARTVRCVLHPQSDSDRRTCNATGV